MKQSKVAKLLAMTLAMSTALAACGNKAETVTDTSTSAVKSAAEEESVEAVSTTSDNRDADLDADAEGSDAEASGEIKIVYTNDIHSYIANKVTDEEGNVVGDGLRLSKVKSLVSDLEEAGNDVLLVDTGDEVQGDIYGAMDEGETIIKLMNATGYDLATIGNHAFDYGMFRFMQLVDMADYEYLSCNFRYLETGELALPATSILEAGEKTIAFVGITTPETISSAAPVYFQNESGEYIYSFDGQNDADELFESVQTAIDSVRDEADYVIALGHIGVGREAEDANRTSEDIIENTTGLDAFIDGHSHTVIDGKHVTDKDGNDVILTQTGSYLSNIGVLSISEEGEIGVELISELEKEDEIVAALEQEWIDSVDTQLNEKIADLNFTLYINNFENDQERWIRAKETNLGDLAADSMYWFFNENMQMDCDVAISNGGGIRTQIEPGDFSYMSAKSVEPFGNMICLVKATGQEIVDALELGANVVGLWDDEWNSPAENGGFLHVAGMKYSVDTSIESSAETDSNGEFVQVAGDYRVVDVEIYNRDTCVYEPIDLEKEYSLAGANYLLRNGGSGLSMFKDNEGIVDYVGEDYIMLADYVKSFASDDDSEYPVISTMNSPLAAYEAYLLDYENPTGAGRITELNH